MTLNYGWYDVEKYQFKWLRVLCLCERTWVRVLCMLTFDVMFLSFKIMKNMFLYVMIIKL